MPERVIFEDGTSALEYTPQEIEEFAMKKFLEESHRWKKEYAASLESPIDPTVPAKVFSHRFRRL